MTIPSRQTLRVLAILGSASMASAQVDWRAITSGSSQLPPPSGAVQQTTCLTADFNRDGADDVLVASRNFGGRVQAWLSQANGNWQRIDIDPTNAQTEAGGAIHDIDGDGDPDVVIGQDFAGSEIYWWENPHPNFGAAWTRRTIKSGGGTKHHDQVFGDFDGDGQVELVAWNQNANQLLLFEIPANPRATSAPWTQRVIFTAPNDLYEGLAAGDVDLDGVVDIVGAGRWWKHVGGGTYQVNVVDAGKFFTRSAVGQLIPGGRPELIYVPGDESGNGFWYEWNGSSWIAHPLGMIFHGHSLDIADLDGDGAMDIFIGEMRIGSASCRVRVLYGNNAGAFTEQVIATGNDIHEGRLADLDGDGDLDIVHKAYNDSTPRLQFWINERSTLPLDRWARHLVDGALPYQAIFVDAVDCDGDGLKDLVAGGWWWKNPGALSGPWSRRDIDSPGYLNFAVAHDFDGDGDLDLFGNRAPGTSASPSFAWAENRGAAGLLVRTNIASGQGNFLQGINVSRFGGPSAAREVALSWHDSSTGVQMLTVPSDLRSNTWSWRRIQTLSEGEDLASGDIDGDGDLDLFLGTKWLENPSWTPHTVGIVSDFAGFGGTPEPDRNNLVDLDGDGDLDAVVGLENGREVVWFENPRPAASSTGPWTRRVLGAFDGQGFSMDVADFDRDGDMDVVLGEHRGYATNRVILLVNEGTTSNWRTVIIDEQASNVIDHHDGTVPVDLDNDGDLDLISIGFYNARLWIFENRAITGGGGQPQPAAPPVLEREGSLFQVARVVAIAPENAAQEVRYTLDGSEPTAASPLYSTPITLRQSTELRARSYEANKLPSEVVSASYAQLPEPLTLWSFDEGAGVQTFDQGRAQNHGVLQGTQWTAGLQNGALEFDQAGTRVRAGSFDVPGSGLTLSGWIRCVDFGYLPSGDARILSKSASTAEQDHVWMLSTIAVGADIRPRLRVKVNGFTHTLVATSGNIAANTWAHVAGTFDGQALALYLNGAEVGRLNAVGSVTQDPLIQVWVGDNPPVGARPFDGVIDEVRIDDRALSAAQIAALASFVPLPGVSSFGTATAACNGNASIEALRAALRPDPDFGFAARAPQPLAQGLFLFGSQPSATGVLFDQATIWIDPAGGLIVGSIRADASAAALVTTPLPWVPDGLSIRAQFVWINDPSCAATTGLVSASTGLSVELR